jgi:hypothetical protein
MKSIDQWLRPFALEESLHAHASQVIASLPAEVRRDLMDDPAFVMCDYEPHAGRIFHVPMRLTSRGVGSNERREPGRTVVLKRTLRQRPVDFVRWVIAHELAHAHLRNGGRWDGDDPERAADALAAGWGFPRPQKMPWQ